MKEIYVSGLSEKVGERVESSFYLADVKTSGNGDNRWLSLILVDRTGRTYGKIWGEYIRPEYEGFKGQVVKCAGLVECFRSQYGIKVETMELVQEAELSDYAVLPAEEKIKEMVEELTGAIDMVEDAGYKALLKKVFSPVRLRHFAYMPASVDMYAAYSGGWIANTLAGLRLCGCLAAAEEELSTGCGVNMDLLITGALLRDVGKVRSFEEGVIDWRLSPRAFLVGCVIDGCTYVQAVNQQLGEKQVRDLTELLHVIASCHGQVKPRTKEAIIVSSADQMAAASAAYETAVRDTRNQGSGDMVYSPYFKYEVMRGKKGGGPGADQQ